MCLLLTKVDHCQLSMSSGNFTVQLSLVKQSWPIMKIKILTELPLVRPVSQTFPPQKKMFLIFSCFGAFWKFFIFLEN